MLRLQRNSSEFDANAFSSISKLEALLDAAKPSAADEITALVEIILEQADAKEFDQSSGLMNKGCFYLFEINQSTKGIELGKKIARRAHALDNVHVERRITNIIGAVYGDIANFASALEYLERAVALSRRIGDPAVEAPCLANVVAVLQEMGHYRQAIALAERVIMMSQYSLHGTTLVLQCASNGLFSAHRIGDERAAAYFLHHGECNLGQKSDPLRRAFFEKARAFYLVDREEVEKAQAYVEETKLAVTGQRTPRIDTLLVMASSICQWGCGDKTGSHDALERLYHDSRSSRLYHHLVLQALVKTHSDSSDPSDVKDGMRYARELVEFTTSVKKAKFYRQLADRQEQVRHADASSHHASLLDPLGVVKDWLTSSDIRVPVDDLDVGVKRVLAKHEELTVIHEDLARMRARSIRREIRTDAVDTAENWAVAAEFFDDETGQHCFRVGHLAAMLAREVGMDETFCVQVEHAARLHDIGKIAVNEVILLKPGPLDAAEMAAMRLHTEVGAQILSGSDDPTLRMATEIARHHHEWWNGAGYPTRLSGNDIPMSARVCAYADVYDALTHARSYKKAWTHERALQEIIGLKETQFDPDLMDPFCRVLGRYRKDLASDAIQGFADMDTNTLIASRKKLMETIAGGVL